MAEALDEAAQEAQMNALMRAPMPRIYANGFGMAQSASDVTVVMLHNNNPTAMVSMSFISAKSLFVDLGKTLEGIEAVLKQPIPTINEIAEEMIKAKGKPSA
jgi:hypothetical protein